MAEVEVGRLVAEELSERRTTGQTQGPQDWPTHRRVLVRCGLVGLLLLLLLLPFTSSTLSLLTRLTRLVLPMLLCCGSKLVGEVDHLTYINGTVVRESEAQ